ncbi:MAG: hypothetical protein ACYDDF_04370 [Thermoplasmatota archaeon]
MTQWRPDRDTLLGIGILILGISLVGPSAALALELPHLSSGGPGFALVPLAAASGCLCALGARKIWQRGPRATAYGSVAALVVGLFGVVFATYEAPICISCSEPCTSSTDCLVYLQMFRVLTAMAIWLILWSFAAGGTVAFFFRSKPTDP